jgi:hypothetical protein
VPIEGTACPFLDNNKVWPFLLDSKNVQLNIIFSFLNQPLELHRGKVLHKFAFPHRPMNHHDVDFPAEECSAENPPVERLPPSIDLHTWEWNGINNLK